MSIQGKKFVKSLNGYMHHINEGSQFYIGVTVQPEDIERLIEIGFDSELNAGDAIIPEKVGKYTGINFDGKEEKNFDLPLESRYRSQYQMHYEFHGKEKIEVWGFANIPFKYRPRKYTPSPNLELTIQERGVQKLVLVNKEFTKANEQDNTAILATNIMLELFKRAELFSDNLEPYIKTTQSVRNINWEILPEGDMPWAKRLEGYKPFTERTSTARKPVIIDRFETIEQYKPLPPKVGTKGFQGYVVFEFPSLGLYVFESMFHGNATYVVTGDWEAVSKMTKSEIIHNSLHEYRFIHHDSWKDNIDTLLKPNLLVKQS